MFLSILSALLAAYLAARLLGLAVAPLRRACRRLELALGFWSWYLLQVQRASLQVALQALGRPVRVEPAIVAVSLIDDDERIGSLIAALLTLTPGSLALEYRPGQRQLFLHILDARSAAAVQAEVDALQHRLLRWLKPASLTERSLP
ncbi:Na+/H+ antiporter subunit E [Pseudomonas stutzeri]|nr:Na+/H+ antiporter subunit E [Stutzerimonas stutzeri]